MKNKEDEKSYEEGWFGGVTIKEKKINCPKDISEWLDDMCNLATNGSKRHFLGLLKKSDKKGMLGVLNLCLNNEQILKDLRNDDKTKKTLEKTQTFLGEVEKAMNATKYGRTKQKGFTDTLRNCKNYVTYRLENFPNLTQGQINDVTKCKNQIVPIFQERRKNYDLYESLCIFAEKADELAKDKGEMTNAKLLAILETATKNLKTQTNLKFDDFIKGVAQDLNHEVIIINAAYGNLMNSKQFFEKILELLFPDNKHKSEIDSFISALDASIKVLDQRIRELEKGDK